MSFNNLTSPSITRLNTQKGQAWLCDLVFIDLGATFLALPLMKRLHKVLVIYPFLAWTVAGLSQFWSVLLFFKRTLGLRYWIFSISKIWSNFFFIFKELARVFFFFFSERNWLSLGFSFFCKFVKHKGLVNLNGSRSRMVFFTLVGWGSSQVKNLTDL